MNAKLSSLVYLKELDLSGSNLEGSIEGLLLPSNLTILDLSHNSNISGKLPQHLPSTLEILRLGGNRLRDCLDDEDECGCANGRCFPYPSSLQSLDLSHNDLYGKFIFASESVCHHPRLAIVDFTHNSFTSIDESDGRLFSGCNQSIVLKLKNQVDDDGLPAPFTCPLPSFATNTIAEIDACSPDPTGLYIVLAVLGCGGV
jgi:uncharacterized protein YjbI with pentapeptide repeats